MTEGKHSYLPSFSLKGKRTVVTGASRGIGRALAIGLAQAGSDVVLLARDESKLAETETTIHEMAPDTKVEQVTCDIRNNDAIRASVAAIAQGGPIDVLMNNAGLNIRVPALDVTDDDWRTVIDTDLRGAFFMAQQVGKVMVHQGRGSVVNVSSVGGHVALRTGVAYAAAKAGVIQMTKVLAMEWGAKGVRVNCIAPWYFRTPLTEDLLKQPDYLQDILDRTPLNRVGEVEELVGPALFLASDAGSYVTGHTLFVDGGMSVFGF
ncbi:SDR family oxidoreductase [Alicyclobacillus sp. SO9]|nr:SDR family oxidoreductase [Alicyclobacillus sp. SO9]